MSAKKVLFITQEITPYVPESNLALIGQNLPQAIQDKGREIRTFMPKWGIVNERKNYFVCNQLILWNKCFVTVHGPD